MLRDLRLAVRMMWQAKAVLDSLSRNQRPLLCDISHWVGCLRSLICID
jgi:hypothetical protein